MKYIGIVLFVLLVGFVITYFVNNKEKNDDFLNDQFVEIEKYIQKRDVKNEAVSQADVAWHLDHILKTVNQISSTLKNSTPLEYKSNFNFKRAMVHTSGIIPRGVAQSPKSVRPPDVILTDSIHIQLAEAKNNVLSLASLDKNAFFSHPVFENLDRDQTRRFIKIHTNHHLKIIKDILKE